MNRFLFEIITEGEVAKHLKKGTMTGSLTDILDIAGTNTFLTGTYSCSRRNLLTRKIWL